MSSLPVPHQSDLVGMATQYLDAGLTPVRLAPRSKGHEALGSREANIVTAANATQLLDGKPYNLGILHGIEYGDLVDVDFDWPETREVGAHVFRDLDLPRLGRRSALGSHLIAVCPGLEHKDFVLPPVCKDNPRFPKKDGDHQLTPLQLRVNGLVVAPPSIHPAGEPVSWERPLDNLHAVDKGDLRQRAGLTAFLAVVVRCWPGEGSRDTAALALAGALTRADYEDAQADAYCKLVAQLARDEEVKSRANRKAKRTKAKQDEGQKTTGMTTLVELLGLDKSLVAVLNEWLRPERGGLPDRTKGGAPARSLRNTKIALELLGIECQYDMFKLQYIVNGHALETFVGELSDPALLRLREMITERFGFDPSTETVHTAVQTLANHRRFHPVRDYLDSLQWDCRPRIDAWLITYGGAEDSDYIRAVGRTWMIAAVRRVRKPGCKFDEMPVLESDQGKNKSSALEMLAVRPEWFTDNMQLNASGREAIESVAGYWIVECAELSGMRKGEIEKIKAYLSRGADRGRLAYARTTTNAPRQCVLAATTNEVGGRYLRDLTGNCRFWPVKVEKFDLEALGRDRDQLWAEAAHREAQGESIRLPEELWAAAADEQQQRTVMNSFTGPISEVLGDLEGKIVTDDLWAIVSIRPERRDQHGNRLNEAMLELGWRKPNKQGKLRINGQPRYVYVKGNEPYELIVVSEPTERGEKPTAYHLSETILKDGDEQRRQDAQHEAAEKLNARKY